MSVESASNSGGRHLRDASRDSVASSTPTRPPRPSRSSYSTPGQGEPSTRSNPARRSLLVGQENDDLDRTPRKGQAHGLPTPPLSEATSSASGSVGRTRKDSAGAGASGTARESEQLNIPVSSGSRDPRMERASSVTSSRTGSDTIGARSPIDHLNSFQSPSMRSESPAATAARFSAGTVGRRRGVGLQTAAASDLAEAHSPSPGTSRAVPRAQSSLGMRSTFAEDGRRSSLIVGRLGEEGGTSETPDRSERRRRSAMHEQEVTQIRTESRLGQHDAIDEGETSPRKPPTTHKYSPRKSTGLSRGGRYTGDDGLGAYQTSPLGEDVQLRSPPPTFRSISRASGGRRPDDGTTEHRPATSIGSRGDYGVARRALGTQMNADEVASASARRRSLRASETSAPGDATLLEASTSRKTSSGRSPIPREFRLPDKEARRAWREAHAREQSDSVTSDGSEGEEVGDLPSRKSSTSEAADSSANPTAHSSETALGPRSSERRKRYASDAQSEELPLMDYDGRLGSQGSRISVDATSANRYLTKGPIHGTPQSARRGSRASEMGSPSEEARIRKISTSSSRSQKSSGGASELHRTASRASMRRVHGRDVFDDETLPPLPGSRSESPALRSDVTSASDRLRSLRQQVGELKDSSNTAKPGWWSELDELRNRIEELAVAGSRAPPLSESRSPSVQSSRTHSALGLQRTPLDTSRVRRAPLTEPRNFKHDRSSTLSELGSGDRSERSFDFDGQRYQRPYSRATTVRSQTSHEAVGRAPATPDPNGAMRLAAGSRASVIHSATLPSTARFPSGSYTPASQRVRSEGSGGEAANPVHDRNMRNAFDMFERYFCAGPTAGSATAEGAGPDSLEMVASFGEVAATASELNSGLRTLIQVALEAQVDAEISGRNGAPVSEQTLECFARLDRDLTDLLKRSDEQVRNLTDGLMAITRAERERDRQRKAAANGDYAGSGARSVSRMSAVTASPVDEIRRSIEARTSSELRRSTSTLYREPASPAGTVVEHGSGDRKDRFRSADRQGTSQRTPASPYSPLQAKATGTIGGTLTASQMRSLASAASSHSRSASEYSPQTRLRREKSTVMDTVKMPALSPRRPKLSFPSVSNATASASHGEARLSDSPITAEGIAFPSAQSETERHLSADPASLGGGSSATSSERSIGARSTDRLRTAGSPLSGHSRRNTVAGTSANGGEATAGLGFEPPSPDTTRRSGGAFESKRSSRIERPPRPPRHDLMRRDTEEDMYERRQPEDGGGEGDESRDSSGIARLGSISRSIGRSAARRISKTFTAAGGSENEGRTDVEEAQA